MRQDGTLKTQLPGGGGGRGNGSQSDAKQTFGVISMPIK